MSSVNMNGGTEVNSASAGRAPGAEASQVALLLMADSFLASTVIVPVSMDPATGIARIAPEKDEALKAAALSCMQAVGKPQLASDLYSRLASALRTGDELWFSKLHDGQRVVLVRDDVLAGWSERDIAARVHMAELRDAAQRGEPVNLELLAFYEHQCLRAGGPKPDLH